MKKLITFMTLFLSVYAFAEEFAEEQDKTISDPPSFDQVWNDCLEVKKQKVINRKQINLCNRVKILEAKIEIDNAQKKLFLISKPLLDYCMKETNPYYCDDATVKTLVNEYRQVYMEYLSLYKKGDHHHLIAVPSDDCLLLPDPAKVLCLQIQASLEKIKELLPQFERSRQQQ